MSKKKEEIKLLSYNIEGKDLENFEKVRDDMFLSIEQVKSGVEYCKNQLDRMVKEQEMWEEIAKQSTNPNFLSMQDTAKEALTKAEEQIGKVRKALQKYEVQSSNLSYIYNTRFTNLPIENGVCVVEPDTIAYCNIAVNLIISED